METANGGANEIDTEVGTEIVGAAPSEDARHESLGASPAHDARRGPAAAASQRHRRLVYPTHCPSCGKPLPPPVGAQTLAAVRALAARPGGRGTSADVRAAGVASRTTRASELLRLAQRAGLVRQLDTPQPTGHGSGAWVYVVNRRLLRSYERH